MEHHDWLADRFEENQGHLRPVAYRMLGSLSEADDAVQESSVRLSRSDTSVVDNIGGWMTTIVARVCLNMLPSRRSRREEPPRRERTAAGAEPRRRDRPRGRSAAGRLGRSRAAGGARHARPRRATGVRAARQLFLVLAFTIGDGRVTEIDVIADPDRLRQLDLAVLGD